MFCKNCGANLNPTDKFCQNCGAPVQPGTATPPPAQPAYAPQPQPVYAPPPQPVYGAPVNPAPMPGYGYGVNPKVQTAQRMLQKYRRKWVFPCIAFIILQVLAIIFYAIDGAYAYYTIFYVLGGVAQAFSGLFFLLWLIFAIIINVNKKIVRRNGQ